MDFGRMFYKEANLTTAEETTAEETTAEAITAEAVMLLHWKVLGAVAAEAGAVGVGPNSRRPLLVVKQ